MIDPHAELAEALFGWLRFDPEPSYIETLVTILEALNGVAAGAMLLARAGRLL